MLPGPQRLKPCSGVGWQSCAAAGARTDPLCQSTKEPRCGRDPEQLCVLNPGAQAQKRPRLALKKAETILGSRDHSWECRRMMPRNWGPSSDSSHGAKGWNLDKHLLFPLKNKSPLFPSTQVKQPGRREAAAKHRRKVGAWCLPCPLQPPLLQFPLHANEFNYVATSEGSWGWQGHEPGEEKALSGDRSPLGTTHPTGLGHPWA